jgi:hypothetical protein
VSSPSHYSKDFKLRILICVQKSTAYRIPHTAYASYGRISHTAYRICIMRPHMQNYICRSVKKSTTINKLHILGKCEKFSGSVLWLWALGSRDQIPSMGIIFFSEISCTTMSYRPSVNIVGLLCASINVCESCGPTPCFHQWKFLI